MRAAGEPAEGQAEGAPHSCYGDDGKYCTVQNLKGYRQALPICKSVTVADLADEYDAAQERGEVRSVGKPNSSNTEEFGAADIGLSHKEIHEARMIRDAEVADPGIVHRTIEQRIESNQEPTKTALRQAVIEAAKIGIKGGGFHQEPPNGDF